MKNNLSDISKLIDDLIEDKWSAGISIKITKNNKEIFKKMSGLQNIENNIPVTDKTIFRVYSMTKPVTAVAFLHLLNLYNSKNDIKCKIKSKSHRGLILSEINYNTKIEHFYKFWKTKKIKTESSEKVIRDITLHDVLSMTGGIPYINKDVVKKIIMWRLFGKKTMKGLSKTISKIKLISQPGEKWNYSLSMDFLGCIGDRILKLTKGRVAKETDWGSFVQNQILKKLDMNDSWYGKAVPKMLLDNIQITSITKEDGEIFDATNFSDVTRINRGGWFESITKDQKVPMGGNTLISTLDDYSKFQNFLITGKDSNNKELIPISSLEAMTTNYLNTEQMVEGEKFLRPGYGYGYGVRVKQNNNDNNKSIPIGTFGWDGMMCTLSLIHRETNICVCLMTSKMRPFSIKEKKPKYSIDEIYENIFKALKKEKYL